MNVIIIEDERVSADRLSNMLQKINPEIEVIQILDSVDSAAKYLKNHDEPDLLLMDIQLSDGISFEIFDLVEITCPVVFTTAYDEFALKAFKVHALDYLLKPVKKASLEEVIDRINVEGDSKTPTMNRLEHPAKQPKMLIRIGKNLHVLKLNEAAYFYSENKMTFCMEEEGKRYPVDQSLDGLQELLDEKRFFRVNRQFIVNEDAIEKMKTYTVNRIKLNLQPKSHTEVIVSKDKVSRFRKWLVL